MTSDTADYASKYPIVLEGSGLAARIARDTVDGLLGAEEFTIDFDVTATSKGESGEILRFGSTLVASVDDSGELVLSATTGEGTVDLRTSGANMADATPHEIGIGYAEGQLAVTVDGESVGAVEMSPLRSQEDSDLHIGTPGDTDNFASKIGSLAIAAKAATTDETTGTGGGTGNETPPTNGKDGQDPEPPEAPAPDNEAPLPDTGAETPAGDVVRVSTSEELYEALSQADGGETILLRGGEYGSFKLNSQSSFDYDYAAEVKIVSEDATNPAIFSEVGIRSASNLTFEKVVFDYSFSGGDPRFIRPFVVSKSDNIVIRDSVFDGDLAQGVSPVADGHGWGTGLSVRDSTEVTVEGTEFFGFWRGAVLTGTDRLTVRDNDIHSLRMDGLNFVAVQDVLIEGNHIHDFDAAEGSSDHLDMIQFWSNGADRPSTDVVIRGNMLDIGAGDWTQSIFMRNEEVDNGRAGYEMFYRDITIEDNVIVNGHRHGISVGETDGLMIRGNSVLHADGRVPDGADDPVEIPWINVTSAARNVRVEDNLVAEVNVDSGAGRIVVNNVLVQDQNPTAPGYYGDMFLSSSLEPEDGAHLFVARPGGLADIRNAGASETLAPSEGFRPGFHIATTDADASVRIFDASHTLLDGTPVGDGARFDWRFSDGTVARDRVVAAVFEEGGGKNVELTVTLPDGTSRSVSHDFEVAGPEVLRFGAGTGLIVDGNEFVDLPGFDDGGVRLASSGSAAEIARDNVIDLVNADEFSLSFVLDGDAGEVGGNIFRLGSSFIGSVRQDGDLLIRAATDEGRIRLETAGPAVNDGAAHEVEIDLLDGILQVAIDGEVAGQTEMSAIADGSAHGLYIGNPWGGNFESRLSDFELTVAASDFETTEIRNIPDLSAFDPLIMG